MANPADGITHKSHDYEQKHCHNLDYTLKTSRPVVLWILQGWVVCYTEPVKLGIILQSNKPEHVWNTFRLGITALEAGHSVKIFLLNEGSELEDIPDSKKFDISARVDKLKQLGGDIYACETCLHSRGKEQSNVCPVSTLPDLLRIIEESDKVLTIG